MIKTLTNETVSKALGKIKDVPKSYWKKARLKPIAGVKYFFDEWGCLIADLPRYTTDLNLITAEIEARGLYWEVGPTVRQGKRFCSYSAKLEPSGSTPGKAVRCAAKTASLALCMALLAYLKERRP